MEELNVNQQQQQEVETEQTTEQVEVKTYTQDELDKLLQAETDRKTTKALETAKAKWEEEFKSKIENDRSETEKLAKLSEAERIEAIWKKKEQEWETERLQNQTEKLEAQTIKELSFSGLPTEFASYLLADNAESIKQNIDTFKLKWSEALEKAVDERIKSTGSTPQSSNKQASAYTKEQLAKMNYHERAKVVAENPDLLKQLK